MTLPDAHDLLARAGVQGPPSIAHLRRVKMAYEVHLQRMRDASGQEAEAARAGSALPELHKAVASDLLSLENRDSAALRVAISSYQKASQATTRKQERRAALLRLAELYLFFGKLPEASMALKMWLGLMKGGREGEVHMKGKGLHVKGRGKGQGQSKGKGKSKPETEPPSDHDDPDALAALASIKMRLGGLDQVLDAAKLLEQSVRANPMHTPSLLRLGHLYARPPPHAWVLHDDTKAVQHLRAAGESSVALKSGQHGRSYWQELGSALARLGRTNDMHAAYAEAVSAYHVWPSMWQRPMDSVRPRPLPTPAARSTTPTPAANPKPLNAKPWWTMDELGSVAGKHVGQLVAGWAATRNEVVPLLLGRSGGKLQDELENITIAGQWKELVLYRAGNVDTRACAGAPQTCAALQKLQSKGLLATVSPHARPV